MKIPWVFMTISWEWIVGLISLRKKWLPKSKVCPIIYHRCFTRKLSWLNPKPLKKSNCQNSRRVTGTLYKRSISKQLTFVIASAIGSKPQVNVRNKNLSKKKVSWDSQQESSKLCWFEIDNWPCTTTWHPMTSKEENMSKLFVSLDLTLPSPE